MFQYNEKLRHRKNEKKWNKDLWELKNKKGSFTRQWERDSLFIFYYFLSSPKDMLFVY